jgi:hypothetical protein
LRWSHPPTCRGTTPAVRHSHVSLGGPSGPARAACTLPVFTATIARTLKLPRPRSPSPLPRAPPRDAGLGTRRLSSARRTTFVQFFGRPDRPASAGGTGDNFWPTLALRRTAGKPWIPGRAWGLLRPAQPFHWGPVSAGLIPGSPARCFLAGCGCEPHSRPVPCPYRTPSSAMPSRRGCERLASSPRTGCPPAAR